MNKTTNILKLFIMKIQGQSSLLNISISVLLIALLISACSEDKSKRPSPPAKAEQTLGAAKIVIDYSQPSVKERTIWGDLVPYGKVWRTGANEATTFTINKDVLIEGQKLKAGKYALFTVPGEEEWEVIFNSVPKQWGAYDYEKDKDVLRVKVKPQEGEEQIERMTFDISNEGTVTLKWASLSVSFDVDEDKTA